MLLFKTLFAPKVIAPETLPTYDQPSFPMMPKEVVYKAYEGGWSFSGSLGPEHVLDLRLFRALMIAKTKEPKFLFFGALQGYDSPESEIASRTEKMAHATYDFYLNHLLLDTATMEEKKAAQDAAAEFWKNLIA